jgi:hypothetical protein
MKFGIIIMIIIGIIYWFLTSLLKASVVVSTLNVCHWTDSWSPAWLFHCLLQFLRVTAVVYTDNAMYQIHLYLMGCFLILGTSYNHDSFDLCGLSDLLSYLHSAHHQVSISFSFGANLQ